MTIKSFQHNMEAINVLG